MSLLLSTVGVVAISLATSSNISRSNQSNNIYNVTEEDTASITNNNIDDAQCMLPSNFLDIDNISIKLKGNVHNKASLNDIDYFYFYIDYKSNVSFSLETFNPNDVESILYQYSYSDIYNGGTIQPLSSSYIKINTQNSIEIMPGTYYFYIGKTNINNDTVSICDYTLNLNIVKNKSLFSYDIFKEIYTRSANGMLWLNSALPYNFLSYCRKLNIDNPVNFHKDKLLQSYKNYSQEQNIKLATIYIRDKDLLNSLLHFFDKYKTSLEARLSTFNSTENLILNNVEIIHKGFDVFASLTLQSTSASFVVEFLIDKISDNFFDFVKLLIKSSFKESVQTVKDTLTNINVILKSFKNALSLNSKYRISGVMCLYLYFSLNKNGLRIRFGSIDKDNLYDFISINNVLIVNTYASPNENQLNRGELYTFTTFKNSLSFNELTPISNSKFLSPSITNLFIDLPLSLHFNKRHFKRFKFTAPEEKAYHFSIYGKVDENDNQLNLKAELFTNYCDAYKYENHIETKSGDFESVDPLVKGCYFVRNMHANEELYIRINNNDFSWGCNNATIVISTKPLSSMKHEHNYCIYSNNGLIGHIASCKCGATIQEKHVFRASVIGKRYPMVCIKCGAKNEPFKPNVNSIKTPISKNGSFVIDNNVYLSDYDYLSISKGMINHEY